MNHISDILNDSKLLNHGSSKQDDNISDLNLNLDLNNSGDKKEENNKNISDTSLTLDKELIKNQIYKIKDQLDSLLRLVNGETKNTSLTSSEGEISEIAKFENGEKIIEGVFNGEKMVGPDGEEYAIPVNYASKSKLVEGDIMKLTITNIGKFIYKQIGPVIRKRLIGKLIFDEEKQLWFAKHDGKQYKILTASVTFYKGKPGDEVIILIPEGNHCDWGAVENIISQ